MLHAGVGMWLQSLGVQAGTHSVKNSEVGARKSDTSQTRLEKVLGSPKLLVGELQLARY